MNMKKTMAAVAACAIATSAVATTAFADDSVSLKYNLVNNVYVVKPGSVTFNSQIEYLTGTADGDYVQIQFTDVSGNIDETNAKFTVTGNAISAGVRDKSFSFVDYCDGLQTWNLNASSMVKNFLDGNIVMTIPVDAAGSGIKAADEGFTATVAVTAPHTGTSWNGGDLSAELSYAVGAGLADLAVTDEKVGDATVNAAIKKYNADEAASAGSGTAVTLKEIVKDLAIVDGTYIPYDGTNGAAVSELYAVPNMVGKADTVAKKVMHSVIGAWSATSEEIIKYPMMTSSNTTSNVNGTYETIATVTNGETMWGNTPNNINGAKSNILSYLSQDQFNLSAKGKSYINVVPVINDVIANYDDVTFTFNTAADGILFDKDNDDSYRYSSDSAADKSYTKFAQHLYNLYGDENTEYVYSSNYDWTGYNLWAGALVVNGNLTMSLQDTNVFDYGATTLSFNWNDAVDGAVVNTYATYLTKLQLATSSVWFWDSLEITAANTEAEDVASDAGAEADEDVIEEDVEEDVVEDIEEDVVEDVVEDIEEPVVEDVVEDVPVVENPGTGNAPVALAVIPVALAAAAVVAKKRG